MADDIWILGIHMTKFGKHPDKDTIDLASEAAMGALADGGVTMRDMGILAADWPKRHMLIVSDSNNSHVYEIRPGRDGRFDTRDDVRRSFGLGKYGFTNVDGVAIRFKSLFMVSSRQDFIVVTDFQGRLIRKIDLSGTGIVAARGATFAPGTGGHPRRLYVTDAGVDESVKLNQNDGRLFELAVA